MTQRQLLMGIPLAILFLFLIQSAGVLVESIYILDLMNTTLDEKAAGILFFFSPLLLLVFRDRYTKLLFWVALVCLVVARGLLPSLDTLGRLLAGGFAAGAALLILPLCLSLILKANQPTDWLLPAQSLAMAAGVSALLRTIHGSLDISLEPQGAWIGWVLGLVLLVMASIIVRLPETDPPVVSRTPRGLLGAGVGMLTVLALMHFAFFSPGVIARWSEGNYPAIVSLVSGLSFAWVFLGFWRPGWVGHLSPRLLLFWNLAFGVALTILILSHTPPFPGSPDAPSLVVSAPGLGQQLLLLAALLLFPVLLVDFSIFSSVLLAGRSKPSQLAPGFLLGGLVWILLIFMLIFTNVWGYVEPVSPFFRGKFWLPFLLAALLLSLLALRNPPTLSQPGGVSRHALRRVGAVLGILFVVTCAAAMLPGRPLVMGDKDTLLVMTYNIQQANNDRAEKSYQDQLVLIRQVDPDILALQESDSARISLGNNDYVRYYAEQLGYYSYYGPRTVTGTYGTALLSKYPLENPRVVFSYSDADEVGTTIAEIVVSGKRFTIFNVHPAGSEQVDLAFARALLEQAAQVENVIALGDYNLRDWEAAYQQIDAVYQNAWMTVYPSGINADGLDMNGKIRIDHIFVSPHLTVRDAIYVLPPASATDHPVHWAWIGWK